MTRIETLEAVLVAAQAVLKARENQMLTRVEWDALAAAVQTAKPDEPSYRNSAVRLVFEDGLMMVMDDESTGYDCLDLGDRSIEQTETQIDRWAAEYAFDVDAANRDLAEYYSEL